MKKTRTRGGARGAKSSSNLTDTSYTDFAPAPQRQTEVAPRTRGKPPSADALVVSRGRDTAGSVEPDGRQWLAHDANRRLIGKFATRADAFAAVLQKASAHG
jgi:hypothetical protein